MCVSLGLCALLGLSCFRYFAGAWPAPVTSHLSIQACVTLSTFAHFCFFEEKSKSVPNVLQYDPYGTQTPWVGQKNSGGFMGVDPIKDPCQVCVNHRQQHAEGAHVAFLASSITRESHAHAHAHDVLDVTTPHSSRAIAMCSPCPPLPLPSPPHWLHRCLRHRQSEGARCHYRLPDQPLHFC